MWTVKHTQNCSSCNPNEILPKPCKNIPKSFQIKSLNAINPNSCTVQGMCSGYKFLVCQWFLRVMHSWYRQIVKLFFVIYLKINNALSVWILLLVERSCFPLQKTPYYSSFVFTAAVIVKIEIKEVLWKLQWSINIKLLTKLWITTLVCEFLAFISLLQPYWNATTYIPFSANMEYVFKME